MKNAAKSKNIEADIFAVSASEVEDVLEKKTVDVLLLGASEIYVKVGRQKYKN